jgi:transcriptional regulator with XRE-family HTH domain
LFSSIYDKIEELRKEKKIPKMDFYERIDMTSKGYTLMVENNSIKVATLQKIAEVLGVPVSTFFEMVTGEASPEGQTEGFDPSEPYDLDATKEVMDLDIPLEEKVAILREMVSALKLRLRIAQLEKLSESKDATIQKLKGLS